MILVIPRPRHLRWLAAPFHVCLASSASSHGAGRILGLRLFSCTFIGLAQSSLPSLSWTAFGACITSTVLPTSRDLSSVSDSLHRPSRQLPDAPRALNSPQLLRLHDLRPALQLQLSSIPFAHLRKWSALFHFVRELPSSQYSSAPPWGAVTIVKGHNR